MTWPVIVAAFCCSAETGSAAYCGIVTVNANDDATNARTQYFTYVSFAQTQTLSTGSSKRSELAKRHKALYLASPCYGDQR